MKRFPSLQLLSFWLFPVWLEAQLAPATLRIPAENGSMQELRVDGGRGLRESADGTVAEAWPLRRQCSVYDVPGRSVERRSRGNRRGRGRNISDKNGSWRTYQIVLSNTYFG